MNQWKRQIPKLSRQLKYKSVTGLQVKLNCVKHIISRSSQTTTSAIGPNAFYDDDAKLAKYRNDEGIGEMPVLLEKEISVPKASKEKVSSVYITISSQDLKICPVYSQLHQLAHKLNERIFFYNEKNPHLGLILNIKEHIYNYYELLGPIQTAWYQILNQHTFLTDLLGNHVFGPTFTKIPDKHVGDLVNLLESLEKKRGISCCKFEKSVREVDNLIQFKFNALELQELIALQVLAQYSNCGYEII